MPGYGPYDRALGAAYLNGLWEAIEKSEGRRRYRASGAWKTAPAGRQRATVCPASTGHRLRPAQSASRCGSTSAAATCSRPFRPGQGCRRHVGGGWGGSVPLLRERRGDGISGDGGRLPQRPLASGAGWHHLHRQKLGRQECLPAAADPGILDPGKFLDRVIRVRLPNPFTPDTPQRIAADCSQKIPVRFGPAVRATLKKYV